MSRLFQQAQVFIHCLQQISQEQSCLQDSSTSFFRLFSCARKDIFTAMEGQLCISHIFLSRQCFSASAIWFRPQKQPKPLNWETTSVADISSFFLSKRKREMGCDGALTPLTAYTRHFPVSCHACVKALSPPPPQPPALLFHIVYGVSLFKTAASGSD